MADFHIDNANYDGDEFRLVAVGKDTAGDGQFNSHITIFESKNPHIVDMVAQGLEVLIDLALEADS